jgi:hypothetical protein
MCDLKLRPLVVSTKMLNQNQQLIPTERIEGAILLLRGQKVMLDADLAAIYGVTTKRLNQQFKRNLERFPKDFAFQLTTEEFDNLRLQFATSSWGGRRHPPYAFTEHGAVMLATVLNSTTAITTSVQVVRAFIKLREMLIANKDLGKRLDDLESKYDNQFAVVFDAIRKLMAPPKQKPREMGYHTLLPKKR